MRGHALDAYAPIVGEHTLHELRMLAKQLRGRSIQHVNSTAVGGGVAEILDRMVPLLNEVGVPAHWSVIRGGQAFFDVTKTFHNALHGQDATFSRDDLDVFLDTNRQNAKEIELTGDYLMIHDPQPIALIEQREKLGTERRWIWRCHVDVSQPNQQAWSFLRPFIERYDGAIFSAPAFSQELTVRQFLIAPSIDPLSEKNRDLPPEDVDEVFARLQVPRDKPIVTQISRFDRLKDPLGVIQAYRLVKRSVDCRLILAGGGATDDPEGAQVLADVQEQSRGDDDIHILFLPPRSDKEINALQRGSDVVVQKSLREGFGLTVSEALWKGRPVVASAVGGIPLQIAHRYSGMLCRSIEGAAHAIKQCLNNPSFAARLGQNGREHVRQNFLLTRHLKEYLLLCHALDHPGESIVHVG